jgi:uncharacterized protein (DUF1499 family)
MLRAIRLAAFVLLAVVGIIIGHAAVTSREESMLAALYEMVLGPPDLGPADFETLRRPATPNSALACPAGFCPHAQVDFDPGAYPVPDEELRRRFARVALGEPRTVPVYRSDGPGRPMQDRYVQRSRLMGFPDTIDVRFIALSGETSTLAVFSRSQIGRSDFGVNLARIRRWTEDPALRAPGG